MYSASPIVEQIKYEKNYKKYLNVLKNKKLNNLAEIELDSSGEDI